MQNSKKIKIIDSCISGVYFKNSSDIINRFGDLSQLIVSLPNDFPQIGILSKDSLETLMLSAWPGDGKNEFRYYKIKNYEERTLDITYIQSEISSFISCEGIKLGLNKESVVELMGNNYVKQQLKDLKIEIYLYENPEYLYQAKYYFSNDKLVEFEYGYVYP
ncbi:hypothetical protein [uncultured Aquimarina sp.]|uniref:hypothetical protein n=1 Tax=uncultured Aquimarina sp. TaxID=575652 RepID=UPI0026018320|nr:hypothetical protein [uncultured Aquimarina sp.]